MIRKDSRVYKSGAVKTQVRVVEGYRPGPVSYTHLDVYKRQILVAAGLGIDFCVNMVQNAQGQPLGIFAGEMEAAHLKGCLLYTSRCV